MLSENDIKNQYIAENIKTIIQNIKYNDYDYFGEHHDELKAVLNYLLLQKSKNFNDYSDNMLEEFARSVRNITLDDKQMDRILNLPPRYILIFAINKWDSKLEDAIIATGDAYYIYEFARRVKGANIRKLEDAIIATEDAEYIYKFALAIKGANPSKLEDAIIATKDAEYIYKFALDIEGANLSKLENAIIATENARYIYKFAKDISDANIEKLTNKIISTGNAQYIYLFAKYVKGASISKLEDAIIATGDAYYIYEFAREVKGANISELEDAIIATGNAEYIYKFAKFVKDANIKKLFYAIINTNDIQSSKYITSFRKLLKHYNFELNRYVDENVAFTTEDFSSIAKKTNLGCYIYESKLSFEAKKMFADYLFDNIDKENNYLILRVYLKMLNNPEITKEEVEALDLEYAAALKKQEASTINPQNPILK